MGAGFALALDEMLSYPDTSCDAAMVASQEVFASWRASPARRQRITSPWWVDRLLIAIVYLAISDQDCGPIHQDLHQHPTTVPLRRTGSSHVTRLSPLMSARNTAGPTFPLWNERDGGN